MGSLARLFVDTSALFSAIWSSAGAGRVLLQLGELQAAELVVSTDVLQELERTVRRKVPEALGLLALILDRARITVSPAPPAARVRECEAWTGHPGDARIVAAARQAGVDMLVTLDRKHLLKNDKLRHHVPFAIGTPGDALAWLRARWIKADSTPEPI